MSEFSGIRARARRKRDGSSHFRSSRPTRATAALVLALFATAAGAEDPHGAPAATPPAATATPTPSAIGSPAQKPAPPATVSPAHKPPPPRLAGPVAAPRPRDRVTWLADPFTGRALGGYDPVAYFLYDRPTEGDPDLQLEWSGTTWLFADEGTRAAFRQAPDVYAPLFGGRDAFAVANGRPAEGSPNHFVIHRGRLLLFADAASRAAFLLDPDRLLAEAERRWPALRADLP